MAPWVTTKSVARLLPRIRHHKPTPENEFGCRARATASLTTELAQESGRVPPEARADLVMTQAHLTRLSVPDEDSDQTLLVWLAKRGFHDVLALRADSGFELTTRKREGLDLCLWVHPERLLRAAINKDPTQAPLHPRELSHEERASLVQAATAVLSEARDKKILSYNDLFLLHEQDTLEKLARLQNSHHVWWDHEEILLDAIAAYFGTKIAYYFAWLQFYTLALVFPTVVGLVVWWKERIPDGVQDTVCAPAPDLDEQYQSAVPLDPNGISSQPMWWQGFGGSDDGTVTCDTGSSIFGYWDWITGRSRDGSESARSTSLTPYFNALLAIWATLFLVMWKRRSNTLAFRWRVHKNEALERAKYMGGWKRQDYELGLSNSGSRGSDSGTGNANKNNTGPVVSKPRHYYCPYARFKAAAAQKATERADEMSRTGRWEGIANAGKIAATSAVGGMTGVVRRVGAVSDGGGSGGGTKLGAVKGGGSSFASKVSGAEGITWELLRTARMFAAWTLEGFLLYLAIRMMLWFAWVEIRSKQQFGDMSVNVTMVRAASVFFPTTFYGMHDKWAVMITKWEGHMTEHSYENSMIVKRFIFRCVNSFSRLFYMGFWQRDLVGLNQMLMTVLLTRSAVDAVQEVVAPTIQVYLRRGLHRTAAMNGGGEDEPPFHSSISRRRYSCPTAKGFMSRRKTRRGLLQCPEVACRAAEKASVVCLALSGCCTLGELLFTQRNGAGSAGAEEGPTSPAGPVGRRNAGAAGRTGPVRSLLLPEQPNRRPKSNRRRKDGVSEEETKRWYREAMDNERTLPEYNSTAEYLDLVIQYGYVTMFAVTFPLAPLLALIRCLAELYIDHQKLSHCRRPPYVDRSGIGAWYGILEFVGMASVLTNCLLLALTAEKLRLYIPPALADQFPNSKHLVMAVFAEHVILGIKFAVRVLIDDVPDGVEKSMARELLRSHEEVRRKVESDLGFQDDVAATDVQIIRDPSQRLHRSNAGITNVSNSHSSHCFVNSAHNNGGGGHSSHSNDMRGSSRRHSSSSPNLLHGFSYGTNSTASPSSSRQSSASANDAHFDRYIERTEAHRARSMILLQQQTDGGKTNTHIATTTTTTTNTTDADTDSIRLRAIGQRNEGYTTRQAQEQQQQQQRPPIGLRPVSEHQETGESSSPPTREPTKLKRPSMTSAFYFAASSSSSSSSGHAAKSASGTTADASAAIISAPVSAAAGGSESLAINANESRAPTATPVRSRIKSAAAASATPPIAPRVQGSGSADVGSARSSSRTRRRWMLQRQSSRSATPPASDGRGGSIRGDSAPPSPGSMFLADSGSGGDRDGDGVGSDARREGSWAEGAGSLDGRGQVRHGGDEGSTWSAMSESGDTPGPYRRKRMLRFGRNRK